jgi:hypothetical protein
VTHQLLVYADDVNLLGDNIDITKEHRENCILLSCHQNAGQNDIKIAIRALEIVAQLKYLATTVRNQNLIQKEITSRLNLGNACYHSVQSLLSSRLLSKNVKITIYKNEIFPIVLYRCETWYVPLWEKDRLRVF